MLDGKELIEQASQFLNGGKIAAQRLAESDEKLAGHLGSSVADLVEVAEVASRGANRMLLVSIATSLLTIAACQSQMLAFAQEQAAMMRESHAARMARGFRDGR